MEQISIGVDNRRFASAARIWLSLPFIYGMIVPLVFFDLCLEFYHHVCFPLYGIPLVKRSRYLRVDRQRLSYLEWTSKLHCLYCGYANGLAHYASVIVAATELYWCPIQHQKGEDFAAPRHHQRFADYGDIQDLKRVLALDRTDLTLIGEPASEPQLSRPTGQLTSE